MAAETLRTPISACAVLGMAYFNSAGVGTTRPVFAPLGTAPAGGDWSMAWGVLFVAGLLETVWAVFMKRSDGFTRLGPSIVTVVAMIASVVLLAHAMRTLPLGTAYAVWTGIGTAGAFIVGITLMGEEVSLLRLGSAGLILIGLVGLKLGSAS